MGREEHCKQTSVVCMGNAPSVLATLGFPPLTECVLSQSTLPRLQVALQGAGPGLRAFPRSKPLRFRYLGSPQRHRLGWACVLFSSQVRAAQVTRCLASNVTATYHLPRPCSSVFWVYNRCTFSGGSDCPESQEVLVSNEACLQFGR